MYTMRLKESTLTNEIREQTVLAERLAGWKTEITMLNSTLKVFIISHPPYQRFMIYCLTFQEFDAKISEAQAPIERLEQEHRSTQDRFTKEISEAQEVSGELNRSFDRLDAINKTVERSVSFVLLCFVSQVINLHVPLVTCAKNVIRGWLNAPRR